MPPARSTRIRQCSKAFHILAAVLIATAVCSCSGHGSSSANHSATSTTAKGTETSLDTKSYRLTVNDASGSVTIAPSSQDPPKAQSYLAIAAPGATVELPGGKQPSGPLTLTYDFHGKPLPFKPGQLPAVVALSEGTTEPEVLPSHWDSERQILTAQTTHLSGFFPFTIDVNALGRQVTQALNGYLGLSSPQPACVGKALVVDDTTYTLDPTTVPAAWPCLSRNGNDVSVDLVSNSPLGWVVRSRPVSTNQGPEFAPDVSQWIDSAFYQTVFAPSVGDGTVLLPGGTTHLQFGLTSPPELIGLRADPGVTLINGFLLGMHAMYPGAKVFDIPGVVSCLKPFTTIAGETIPSGADLGGRMRPLIDCVTSGTDAVSTNPIADAGRWAGNIATKSLNAVLSLGPDIANQLAATLSGFFGEFTGQNTETINVRTDKRATPVASGPATLTLSTKGLEAGGGLMIGPNHYKFSPKSHDKKGYYVDLSYRWTIDRPENSDLGYCKGHITVTDSSGATVYREDDDGFNACQGGGGWGAHIKLYNAGTYTVSAAIDMERGPTLHGTVQFTVDPL
ncbi:hypothetical protein PT015_06415 [Candidatus Mycobacterium wuenschmannii]|uniref:Uncharacterized protein n=1 Tax=Candidatus Mycobacterium wuenschmannii TaxID=3027808 RepID=A0ABY8W5M8_9MYCO|nr:hypothetical protein [Candidatus Mycobacterium wuenschmannii]WIM89094.1 hypothetical protein PT015_06415 [Candidatus Mycobacterium wuenschmannii]